MTWVRSDLSAVSVSTSFLPDSSLMKLLAVIWPDEPSPAAACIIAADR